MLRRGLVETFTFASEHDGRGSGIVDLIVRLGTAFVETVDPVACLFQFLHRAVDVRDLHDGNVGERSGCGSGDGFGETCRAALWNYDGYCAGGMRGTDDGSQIVWIFDAVEDDVQAASGDGLLQCGIFLGGTEGDNSLMRSLLRGAIQGFAGFEANDNLAVAAQVDDLLQAMPAGSFDD